MCGVSNKKSGLTKQKTGHKRQNLQAKSSHAKKRLTKKRTGRVKNQRIQL